MSDVHGAGEEPEDEILDDEIIEEPEDEETVEEPEEPGEGEEEPPPRQPSRADNRVAEATRIAAEAKREAAEAKAALEAVRAERAREQAGLSEAQERERLAQMSPEEQVEYRLNKMAKATDDRLNHIQFQSWDATDKATFTAAASVNPALAAVAVDVETELNAMRAKGQNVDRQTLAAYLIGRKALDKAPRARAAGARAAEAGRARQTARPSNSRGDVPSGGRPRLNELAALEKRLEGKPI